MHFILVYNLNVLCSSFFIYMFQFMYYSLVAHLQHALKASLAQAVNTVEMWLWLMLHVSLYKH